MADGGDDTSSSVTTQNLPSYLTDASKSLVAGGLGALTQPYQPYQGPRVAPMTDAQNQAMAVTQGALGARGPAYQNATATATGLLDYAPSTVTAQQISGMPTVSAERVSTTPVGFERVNAPTPVTYDKVTGQMIDPSQAGQTDLRQMTQAEDILAKLFPEMAQNIDAYMNPYISSALNPTLREMSTQNDALQNQINAQAAAGGSFGGSRHGIVNAEQNRNYGQAVGDVTQKAYSDAFEKARQSIFQDIGNTLTADTSNQAMQQRTGETNLAAGISTDQFNAGNTLKALLANQDVDLRAGIANQGAGVTTGVANMDAALRAALSNQSAGVTTGIASMDAALRAAMANQSTGLQAQTTNLDAALRAAIANQGADLTAQTSNQGAGLQGAALNLNAAKSLEDMGYRNLLAQTGIAKDLYTMGAGEQALGQKSLDTAYTDFQNQNNYGFDQLTKFANLLKASPTPITSTTTTDAADPNMWTQLLGGAATGASLAKSFGLI